MPEKCFILLQYKTDLPALHTRFGMIQSTKTVPEYGRNSLVEFIVLAESTDSFDNSEKNLYSNCNNQCGLCKMQLM